jgi:polysaccharide pyruvyl transferase WcaK-like protein
MLLFEPPSQGWACRLGQKNGFVTRSKINHLRFVSEQIQNMRILVEPSDYVLRNAGDTAMLQIAIERLSRQFVTGRIQVFSHSPEQFPFSGSNVEAISTEGRQRWFALKRRLACDSRASGARFGRAWCWLLRFSPALALKMLRTQAVIDEDEHRLITSFLATVQSAHLIVVTGMGGITDAFPGYAEELMEVIGLAQKSGAASAMLGQGLGPLESPRLRSLARAVFPRLGFIALRESTAGVPLCRTLGVPASRVIVTGDDAIELALRHAAEDQRTGLGINIRAASYSGIQADMLNPVRVVLHRVANALRAPLVAVPISRVPGEEDAVTIRQLLDNFDTAYEIDAIDTPESVIRQLGKCRLLIAGSYHAGVFALANGIPVVALTRSRYYEDKFYGLASMFRVGCDVLQMDDARFGLRLEESIITLWNSADDLRPVLVHEAERQLAASQAAFRRLSELV